MKFKPGLPQALTYFVTGALLLYQFIWELTHCCTDGEIIQELVKFFTEGWLFLIILVSGSLLLISAFLRIRDHPDARVTALIATLIGLVDFFSGFWLLPLYVSLMFERLSAFIFVLSNLTLLISFIISIIEFIRSLRRMRNPAEDGH